MHRSQTRLAAPDPARSSLRRRTALLGAGLLAASVAWSGSSPSAATTAPASRPSQDPSRQAVAPPTLRESGDATGRLTGFMVNWGILHKPKESQIAITQGNTISPTDWEQKSIWTTPGSIDFSRTDWVRDFANRNGLKLHISGSLAARNLYNPDWLNNVQSPQELDGLLARYVNSVMGRYGDDVDLLRVSHEVSPDYDNVWYRMGMDGQVPKYIERAYQLAAAARGNRKVILYHDDSLNAALGERYTESTYQLVMALRKRGLPVDAVGFQMHLRVDPDGSVTNLVGEPFSFTKFSSNLRRYERRGIPVYLTELDVRVPDGSAASLSAQARVYRSVARRCLGVASCKGTLIWGIDDDNAWEQWNLPTLYDAAGEPKPAFSAFRDAYAAAMPALRAPVRATSTAWRAT